MVCIPYIIIICLQNVSNKNHLPVASARRRHHSGRPCRVPVPCVANRTRHGPCPWHRAVPGATAAPRRGPPMEISDM